MLIDPERFFFLRTNMTQRYKKQASHPNHPYYNLQLADNQYAKFLFTKIDEVRKKRAIKQSRLNSSFVG
jgi:hypothetical protein